ncbi:hypothetical protein V1478_000716 [Vespula squamosa]|uniref:Uncharacterized protein n=1 Tax=Vespula squamosa TaxID=30214 RepID=A0ABD2C6W1_VESSQ
MNKRNDIVEFYLDSNCFDSYSVNDNEQVISELFIITASCYTLPKSLIGKELYKYYYANIMQFYNITAKTVI